MNHDLDEHKKDEYMYARGQFRELTNDNFALRWEIQYVHLHFVYDEKLRHLFVKSTWPALITALYSKLANSSTRE